MKDRKKVSSIQANPKLVAQKCPVCNGWGTVSFKRVTCHSCEGKGYIILPIEREKEYGKYTEE